MKKDSLHNYLRGFTTIELLIVIVIIGILAAIAMLSYTGITNRAIVASLQSDLANSSKKLEAYYALYRSYPTMDGNNCPTAPTVNNDYCLKTSPNNVLSYWVDNTSKPKSFRLTVSKNGIYYSNNEDDIKCPQNFIVVPGSTTYGTEDFCVMKYEAKRVGSTTTPISQASGLPWVNVPQEIAGANNDAKEYSTNVAGCTGCHLITEAEWLTIAQNVLSVSSNWSSGVVGTGYIYSGHNDSVPDNALEASTNDNNGYANTNDVSGNQKRTLSLTNGEVIWDLAGNVLDRTTGQAAGGQPGVSGSGLSWHDWPNATVHGILSPDPFPGATGISGASSWTSAQGIGQLFSDSDSMDLHAFSRGGWWSDDVHVGVLTLHLAYSPGESSYSFIGFRVAR